MSLVIRKIIGKHTVVLLLLVIIVSAFVYRDSFGSYFFQDDWFTLRISNAKSITAVLQFFIPRNDVIYYRPIGMQMPFFILRNLFGINPLPFHIFTMLTHALNIFLVYYLIKLLKKDILIALFSAFLYGVSAVHYIPMFWPSTYAFVLGPALFFISFILFILSVQRTSKILYFISIGSFILGLLTNEMLVVLVPILLFYEFYSKKMEIKKLFPYVLAVSFIFLLRFIVYPPPVSGSYQLGLGREVFINLRGYLLWSFNWPEEMKAQFVSLFGINSEFIREFSGYFRSFIITLFISVLFMIVIPVILLIRERRRSFIDLFIFSFGWFVAGLLPILFFTAHSFSYYLPISLVGLLLFSGTFFRYLIGRIYKTRRWLAVLLAVIILVNWTYSSIATIDFNSKIHWAPRRAILSKILIDEVKINDPNLKKNTVKVSPSSENKLALNNQDALRVIYNDDNLITVYDNPQIYAK